MISPLSLIKPTATRKPHTMAPIFAISHEDLRRIHTESYGRSPPATTPANSSQRRTSSETVVTYLVRRLLSAWRWRRASRELARLSDTALADIGLTRAKLPEFAVKMAKAARGRTPRADIVRVVEITDAASSVRRAEDVAIPTSANANLGQKAA